MIPICLVTGFLGSGKTTFVKQIAARHAGEKIVYLVNDFSPRDVDGALLEQVEEDVVTIPGGSIFCRCLVTQFLGRLRSIPERFGTADQPVRGVVIEASGIADPAVIDGMLAETGLDRVYEVATIVAIVDPASLPKLVMTLPTIAAQIRSADLVLLNKVDQFDEGAVAVAGAIVRRINADAPIVRTVRCAAEVDLFAGGRTRALEGDYAPCADPNFVRFSVGFEEPVALPALLQELRLAREDIYRAKGFVPTEGGLAYVDMSEAGLSAEPEPAGTQAAVLAIIARANSSRRVQELIGRLSATG
jgi:G3E family GTPase